MFEELDNLKRDIQEYIEVKLDLIRIHTAENLSRILSNAVVIAVTAYLGFLAVLFISMAAGFFMGSVLGSNELGFLCVAGFYLLVLACFLLFRKQIIDRHVIKAIIRLLFPELKDEEKKQ